MKSQAIAAWPVKSTCCFINDFADVAPSHDPEPSLLTLKANFDPRLGTIVANLPSSSIFHSLKPCTLCLKCYIICRTRQPSLRRFNVWPCHGTAAH